MGTKTIGITDDVYERLRAEKREDESFTDTIARLLDAIAADWRHGFGRYSGEDADALKHRLNDVYRDHAAGFDQHQRNVLEELGFELDEEGNILATPDDAE